MEIWAHRGASAGEVENTLAAFARAVDVGADGVELDARLSLDGEIVTLHDRRVGRLFAGHGRVDRLTLEELQALRCRRADERRIPTLRAVYELLRPTGLTINVELKGGEALAAKCVELARRMDMGGRIIYSSFDCDALLRVRALEPGARLGLLCARGWDAALARAKAEGFWGVHPRFPLLWRDGTLAACRAAGLRVCAWTVDDPRDLRRLADMGVDAVITNRPDEARGSRGGGP